MIAGMRIEGMLAVLAILVASCSSGSSLAPDGGRCTGDLTTVGHACAATFDGTEAGLPACPAGIGQRAQTAWRCQDLIILQYSYALDAQVCYYDATSHALVGAGHDTDTPAYCGGSSATIEAGRTNGMCRENAPLFTRDCTGADGGT